MTRKIKAQDLKPGMKIEWTEYGWTHSGTVSEVQDPNRSSLFISFRAADELWMCVDKDLKVTVLKEAQPEEPTAFGAAVEVDGVKYVRVQPKHVKDHPDYCPWISEYGVPVQWDYICTGGTVEVKPYPFANTEQREPRVWDRWADLPEMTPVRVGGSCTLYRKVDGRIERKPWTAWATAAVNENDLDKYSPFTEVLPGA